MTGLMIDYVDEDGERQYLSCCVETFDCGRWSVDGHILLCIFCFATAPISSHSWDAQAVDDNGKIAPTDHQNRPLFNINAIATRISSLTSL